MTRRLPRLDAEDRTALRTLGALAALGVAVLFGLGLALLALAALLGLAWHVFVWAA